VDKEFYANLLDEISDGVYFVTRDRRITYWNGGAQRITGYSVEEVLGRSCGEGILRHVNDRGRQLCLHGCPLIAVMTDGKPREANIYLHHKDGQRVPVTVRGKGPARPRRHDRRVGRGLLQPGDQPVRHRPTGTAGRLARSRDRSAPAPPR